VSYVRAAEVVMLKKISPEESVEEDVQALRESPFFKGMQIMGFVQDTETGLLKEMTWGKSTGHGKIIAIAQ